MTRRLGFGVDLSSCTGCKACQIACKDKHRLPDGMLWRRVVEAQGGTWARKGDTWADLTHTYFMSVACMHCERPICVEVCPSKAMQKREDGVVFVDPDRCIGCRYCEWACPYAAPQFDAETGVMTKCDLCRDHLEKGRAPACVQACPMRVLTLENVEDVDEESASTFPLPPADLTGPVTLFRAHRDVAKAKRDGARIANDEEL